MLIGIIVAMDEELVPLKSLLGSFTTEVIGPFEFYKGELYTHTIVLLKSGIGKVNAAASCTLLINKFKPEFVINTGSAGAFDQQLNVGDIVVSSHVFHHDADLTGFGYDAGQLPQLPKYFLPDEKLVSLVTKQMQDSEDTSYLMGVIGSGDRFISDPADVSALQEKFPDMIACEMEAAAIAQICYQFNVPFVIVRSVSDIAGKENVSDFKIFLSLAAQRYTRILKGVLKKMYEIEYQV